ncbi:MAG TPA: ABC transporter ATP-binding protein [Spirochaetota bacterium]|nr:ABC transporter ATP-binding protein [Spirochaetota bacterium]
MNVFTADSLCAGYRNKEVLHDIDLAVDEGEFVAIIGPNGAGKSTLLRLLSGYIAPSKGNIHFMGRPVAAYTRREFSRELSVVPQFVNADLSFTVREFGELGLFPHRKILDIGVSPEGETVDAALDAADISHLRDRRMTEISGGERQLAYIARALVQSSRVMLLDEPVSHLDISHAIRIMDVLHAQNRQGTTVITVLHDVNLAAEYCSRIIALKDGRVFGEGEPRDVLTYENVEGLFDTVCIVTENPVSKRPLVYPVPGFIRGN